MPEEVGEREGAVEPELEERILDVFDESDEVSLSTYTVAEAVDREEDVVEDHLERLAAADELVKVDLEGQYVGWERATETFVGHVKQGSYRITDEKTGLVTRADSRTTALRRLADRIDLLEDGSHVGAQILGICEASISPGYFDDVGDILDSYVRPDNRHLYVYVEDEGVTEVDTAAELTRELDVLGFTVTGVFDEAEFSDLMIVSAEEAMDASRLEPEHFPVGVFKVTAVHPDHQQQGVGTALVSHALAYLAETPPVLTMMWQRDDESNERLGDNFGAEPLAAFDDVSPLGTRCPQCGFDVECSCVSVLYGWGVEDPER